MPPKKKKGKGKAPKLSPEEAAEQEQAEADKAERDKLYVDMDGDQLALNQEKESFNEFQQQREKLNYFWIVEKKRLDDKKSDFRNKVRELEDLQEKHGEETTQTKMKKG